MLKEEDIRKVIDETEENISYIKTISDEIVSNYTSDLDTLMREINENIVVQDNPSDRIIEKYFSELTNALYFIGAKCEYLGFYEDVSKSNAKLKYNQAYFENKAKSMGLDKKSQPTVADNQIAAENASITETAVNFIYSRSFKIIKLKIESAQEMVKTLSKLLSKHMQEYDSNKYNVNTKTDEIKGEYYG